MKIIYDALRSDETLCKWMPKSEVATATTYAANVLNSMSGGSLGHSILLAEVERTNRQTVRIAKDKDRHAKEVNSIVVTNVLLANSLQVAA
jgi:hypothetical protein